MRELKLRTFKQARIWLNELPDISYEYDAADVLQSIVKVPILAEQHERLISKVAVEILIPGGLNQYGILGAEIKSPCISGELLVKVMSSDKLGRELSWALASRLDNIFTGLPTEYAVAVLEKAVESPIIQQIGEGVLEFRYAAHGVVGSSINVFKRLCSVTLELLCQKTKDVNTEQIEALISPPKS